MMKLSHIAGPANASQDGHGEVYAKAGGQTAYSHGKESGTETEVERFCRSRWREFRDARSPAALSVTRTT